MSKSISRNLWAATSLLLILAMLLGFAGSLAVQAADGDEPELRGAQPLPKAENQVGSSTPDPVVQGFPGIINMPGTIENWEGIPSTGVYPPDTDGQVGPNHYVQIVNAAGTGSRVRVWDKSGNQLYDFGLTNLWPSGDRCQLYGYGDPVVLYDQIADRWLLTQFTYPPSGPYNECIAVSKTGVPTSSPSDWYLYTFNVHNTKFNDYPKIGVWPDGYYMMAHQFTSTWGGTGVWVLNRTKMINGTMAQAPTPITCSSTSTDCYYKDLYPINSNYGGMLPVNLMGNTLPPTGSPNYFVEVDANWYGGTDVMTIFGFKVDWNNPANSQFGRVGELVVADFDSDICSAYREQCIDQPGTSVRLEAISDRLMMHAWYRNMGDYETIVMNHTVDAGGRAGIRWYEIRKDDPSIPNINPSPPAPNWGPWELHQQGTYAPDNHHRWMGSIAMDAVGNIALGYSISSSSVYPGIRYAGRLATDPLGTLPQAEGIIINGSGSQTGSGARWGDYSAMSVDPVDDCTFWYTTEYMQTTSATGWQTRVASFKFPNCEAVNPGTLRGQVTNNSTSAPIQGVKVQISGADSYQANTNSTGNYAINVNPGTYTVTFSMFGYSPVTVNGVVVESDETTTQNAQLAPLPTETVAGVVTDANTGWPLYAQIDVSTTGFEATYFSDPVDGGYAFDLPQGFSYQFVVNAVSAGYTGQNRNVNLITEVTEDFALQPNLTACNAPGYALNPTCMAVADGLVVGNVYDENTVTGMNGATVSDQLGNIATTFATPVDPNEANGFYILGSLAGERQLTAAFSTFGPDSAQVIVLAGQAVRQDFYLPSARLDAIPASLNVNLHLGDAVTRTVMISNSGTSAAEFWLGSVNAAATSIFDGVYDALNRRVGPKRLNDLEASAVYQYQAPEAARLVGPGALVATHDSGLAGLWGLGINPAGSEVWLGSVSAAGGNDSLNRYLLDGTATGTAIDISGAAGVFAADLTYNPFSGLLWQVDVGGGNCIYAVDPTSSQVTGERICFQTKSTQRSVAYDVTNDSFFLGSWIDGSIHQIDTQGNLLSTRNLGLNISGLAYNPATNHLFVLSNANHGYDIYVLAVNQGYALLGGFDVPGLGDFEAGGLDIDCDGNLWIANQATGQVLVVTSGETGVCGWESITWLDVAPTAGVLDAGQEMPLAFSIDTTGLKSGLYQAQVRVNNDTPYGTFYIPVRLNLTQKTYAVSLDTAFDALGGDPDQTVTYYLEITNLGKNSDSFSIAVDSEWAVSAPVSVGNLISGQSQVIAVAVTVPSDALAGDFDIASVTATSVGDPAQSASLDLTTTANAVYGVSLLPGTLEKTGLPGTVVTYDLLITNQGNASDSFDLVIGGESWDTTVNATVGPLAAGASTTVTVSVTVPALAANGSMDNAILTATSQADGSQSAASSLTTTARFYRIFAPIIVE